MIKFQKKTKITKLFRPLPFWSGGYCMKGNFNAENVSFEKNSLQTLLVVMLLVSYEASQEEEKKSMVSFWSRNLPNNNYQWCCFFRLIFSSIFISVSSPQLIVNCWCWKKMVLITIYTSNFSFGLTCIQLFLDFSQECHMYTCYFVF